MKFVYELTHKRLKENDTKSDERIYETKLLGFFLSEEKCQEMISFYLTQPGFEKYPDDFIIEEIEADVDDFNKVSGEFEKCVYFLSHEWYDGVYDYVSSIGYYSTLKKAEEAEKKYRLAPEFVEHQEGFIIDEYKIGEREWKEGFLSWED